MAFDAFLNITRSGEEPKFPPDIKGESTDAKRKDWIQILAFKFAVEQASTANWGGGAGAGAVKVGDFSIVKKVDQATPSLYLACCEGEHFDTVQVRIRKAGGNALDYLIYTFSTAIITAVRTGGNGQGADEIPLEEVSFNFARYAIDYYRQDAHGHINPPGAFHGGWDVKRMIKA